MTIHRLSHAPLLVTLLLASLAVLTATTICLAQDKPAPMPGEVLAAAYNDPESVTVRRFDANPIIRPDMLPENDGRNINGPSLIRVPDWLPDAMGKYYLYFAHHHGKYIRLAYADKLEGPWTVHEPGTLKLKEVDAARGHIASPDVLIDSQPQQLRMYFHAPVKPGDGRPHGQHSFVATSTDGLNFTPTNEVLGLFYFRVFQYDGRYYALAKGGRLYSSADGLTNFRDEGDAFPLIPNNDPHYNAPGSVRHNALHVVGDTLYIFYTAIGDAPERILLTTIDLSQPVDQWQANKPVGILRPETEYEGADLPIQASRSGAKHARMNALRDPAVFIEDGRVYLLYSVAGEAGIAIAEITLK